jgi:hypothetical protein
MKSNSLRSAGIGLALLILVSGMVAMDAGVASAAVMVTLTIKNTATNIAISFTTKTSKATVTATCTPGSLITFTGPTLLALKNKAAATILCKTKPGTFAAAITATPGGIKITGGVGATGSKLHFGATMKFHVIFAGKTCIVSLGKMVNATYTPTTKDYSRGPTLITSPTVTPATTPTCATTLKTFLKNRVLQFGI